jgi:UDP-2,3-diacylglucosamine hydrolase
VASTLLLSDLHLAPARPRAVAAFEAFARGPARRASAVYILGDLFDWWVGDDQLRDAFHARIAAALKGITAAGVALFVAHGNRDFMLGRAFAAATGATLLPEHTVVALGGVATLLTHGDELCTDDRAYQAYRTKSRNPEWQRRVLAKPYWMRRAIALYLRLRSRAATAQKPETIMDVNPGAVADAFRRHEVERIVHGHTHRPAAHDHVVDGKPRERHVLAAWHDDGHYLEIDDAGVHERTVTGATT